MRLAEILKKYLIPHEGNDHRPHLLRPRAVIFVCMIALAIEGIFVFSASFVIPRSRLFGAIFVNALVEGTNAARLSANLPALHENSLLDLAAQEKANDMVAHGYFAHTSPDGVTPWYWFKNVGYNYEAAGENLAVDFADSSDVTDAWLASPEHKANIMDGDYTEIGMALAQGTFEGHSATYVVELFGEPMPVFNLASVADAAEKTGAAVSGAAYVGRASVTAPAGSASVHYAASAVSVPAAATARNADAIKTTAPVESSTDVAAAAPLGSVAGGTKVVQAAENNPVQSAAADPRRSVDYVYFVIALIFAAALILNIFVKIRIQHPQVIFGGMLVILIAGLFVVLNQHFAPGVMVL